MLKHPPVSKPERGFTMKIRAFLIAVLVVLTVAPAAQAQTVIVAPEGNSPYQKWVDMSLIPTPAITVTVLLGTDDCKWGFRPLGCSEGTTIWLWPELYKMPAAKGIFLHELGHVYDAVQLPAWARERFLQLSKLPLNEWDGNGDERFADIYSLCAQRVIKVKWQPISAGEGLMSARAARKTCRMIRMIG